MNRRKRRTFADEFRSEIVRMCRDGNRTVADVAREFDLSNGSVRQWVKQAEADANPQAIGVMTAAEREEASAMRNRLKQLKNAFCE